MKPLILPLAMAMIVTIAHAGPVPSDSIAARADRLLAARTALGQFSGAALIARGSATLFARGYGYADFAKRTPFTPATRIPIASLSKMFTAMAALELREQGRLRLDDTLARWVDRCPDAWKSITLDQLIHHTSGIPDYEEPLEIGSAKYFAELTRPDAAARLVEQARTLPLDFAPGTKLHYSNTGYLVLGQVVEKAAARPFADYVAATLLGPAGMKRSGVFDGKTRPEGLAAGFTYEDLGWERSLAGVALTDTAFHRVPALPLAPPAGDAGMYSTVEDLFAWSRAMDGAAAIPPALAHEALAPSPFGYAAGWWVDRASDRLRQRHGGILPGALSSIVRFPEDSLTIVVVANQDRARIEKIVRELSAIALGQPFDLPVHGALATLGPADYARLEGDYDLGDGRRYVVKKGEDLLTVHVDGRFTAGLIPLGPAEFYFPLGDGRATFVPGPDGRPASLNLRYDGADHVGTRVVSR